MKADAPHIKTVADALSTLAAVQRALVHLQWTPEYHLCVGLTDLLATLVQGETVPGTPEHKAASAILDDEDAP